MRFLHTSDWHLGMTFKSGITYKDDQKYFIDEICKIAVEEKVDGILLAGDVFDKSIASQDALQLYNESMTYICGTLNIPVYLIAGNHDGAERISSCHELLKKSGLHIAGSITREPAVVRLDGVDIYMLPWISTDRVRGVYPERVEDIESLEDAYGVVLDAYRSTFTPNAKHILIAHAFLTSAETSVSDHAAEVGRATMIGTKVFDGFDYVALGHIHGPQKITDTLRYSGTPMPYAFGSEEKQEKSVVILDTDTMEQRLRPVSVLRKRSTLKGTYDELMAAAYPQDVLDGYVRLEVTDSFVGIDSLAAFRERYKNLLEVSGKNFEKEDAKITMTVEELEAAQDDPDRVFEKYCQDILEVSVSDHMKDLFQNALAQYEKEVAER